MRVAAVAILAVAVALVLGGVAAAQPAAGSGAGTGSARVLPPSRIEIKPGQPVLQPVRPAQPGQPTRPGQGLVRPPLAANAGSAAGSGSAVYTPGGHGDMRIQSATDNKLMAVLFWVFAAITIGFAAFVITRRNLIAAVMGMVGAFFGVAAIYMMLFASFLAVVQMLVYAGAIMVLFVFVIMILNKPEAEPWGGVGKLGKGIAGLGLAYLVFRLVALLWSVVPGANSAHAPPALEVRIGNDPEQAQYAWGGIKSVGTVLFNGYLFPFEAISILLLVSVVGAIAIARPLDDLEIPRQGSGGDDEPVGPIEGDQ